MKLLSLRIAAAATAAAFPRAAAILRDSFRPEVVVRASFTSLAGPGAALHDAELAQALRLHGNEVAFVPSHGNVALRNDETGAHAQRFELVGFPIFSEEEWYRKALIVDNPRSCGSAAEPQRVRVTLWDLSSGRAVPPEGQCVCSYQAGGLRLACSAFTNDDWLPTGNDLSDTMESEGASESLSDLPPAASSNENNNNWHQQTQDYFRGVAERQRNNMRRFRHIYETLQHRSDGSDISEESSGVSSSPTSQDEAQFFSTTEQPAEPETTETEAATMKEEDPQQYQQQDQQQYQQQDQQQYQQRDQQQETANLNMEDRSSAEEQPPSSVPGAEGAEDENGFRPSLRSAAEPPAATDSNRGTDSNGNDSNGYRDMNEEPSSSSIAKPLKMSLGAAASVRRRMRSQLRRQGILDSPMLMQQHGNIFDSSERVISNHDGERRVSISAYVNRRLTFPPYVAGRNGLPDMLYGRSSWKLEKVVPHAVILGQRAPNTAAHTPAGAAWAVALPQELSHLIRKPGVSLTVTDGATCSLSESPLESQRLQLDIPSAAGRCQVQLQGKCSCWRRGELTKLRCDYLHYQRVAWEGTADADDDCKDIINRVQNWDTDVVASSAAIPPSSWGPSMSKDSDETDGAGSSSSDDDPYGQAYTPGRGVSSPENATDMSGDGRAFGGFEENA